MKKKIRLIHLKLILHQPKDFGGNVTTKKIIAIKNLFYLLHINIFLKKREIDLIELIYQEIRMNIIA